MAKRIGVIGSGEVAQTLAAGFHKHGYDVRIGSRAEDKTKDLGKAKGIATGTFAQVAEHGEIVVLAVKGKWV